MLSVPLPTVIVLTLVVGAACVGTGFVLGHGVVGDPAADPYKYCYHLNLTSNSSLIPQPFRTFIVPGVYAICKVG